MREVSEQFRLGRRERQTIFGFWAYITLKPGMNHSNSMTTTSLYYITDCHNCGMVVHGLWVSSKFGRPDISLFSIEVHCTTYTKYMYFKNVHIFNREESLQSITLIW